MSTGARRRRRIRASRRAQVNPVKPLPTITMEVTDPSVGGFAERVPAPHTLVVVASAAKTVGQERFIAGSGKRH